MFDSWNTTHQNGDEWWMVYTCYSNIITYPMVERRDDWRPGGESYGFRWMKQCGFQWIHMGFTWIQMANHGSERVIPPGYKLVYIPHELVRS